MSRIRSIAKSISTNCLINLFLENIYAKLYLIQAGYLFQADSGEADGD